MGPPISGCQVEGGDDTRKEEAKETELPTLLLVPPGHEFLLRLLSKFSRPETFLPKLALRK